MNSNICPKIEKCPTFIENVLDQVANKAYRNIFCLDETGNHKNCKRFIVSEKLKKTIPANILPNTFLTVDQIVAKIQQAEKI